MPMGVELLNPGVFELFNEDLRQMAHDFGDHGKLRRPFKRIQDEVVIPSIATNFAVGGRPSWEPLSQATIGGSKEAYLSAGDSGGPIGGRLPLNKTGQLRRAATAKARFTIKDNTMTYGNFPEKRWFGPVHDLGLAEHLGVPARPFAILQDEDNEKIFDIMMDWIEDVVDDNIKLHYV